MSQNITVRLLNSRSIIPPAKKQKDILDTNLPGFGVRVSY